jgi:hypothetical protein
MKTTMMKRLQKLIKQFEKEVLFHVRNDELQIISVLIDHKDKIRRVIIIADEKANRKEIESVCKHYFEGVLYKIITSKVLPEQTTVTSGRGIRNYKSMEWGTLGGFFKNRQGKYFGITNSHVVLAPSNFAKGDNCIQYPNIIAGKLCNWTILKPPPKINTLDAALIEIYPRHARRWDPVAPKKMIGPKIGISVYKNGKTTGLTRGRIKSLNISTIVRLNGRVFNFSGAMAIVGNSEEFSSYGDSGSIIFSSRNNHMIGLVFAKIGAYCYALPISRIKKLLKDAY